MGLESSTRKKEFAEPDVELIENLSYEEAVQYLKKRDVLTKIDYDELNDKLKFRAFTASRINDGQLLSRINSTLIKNVKDGNGLGDFLRMTKDDLLDKVGMGPNQGWYWETVYRTNVQTAYNAGRAMGFEEDNPLALELIAIDDARTTDFCRQFAGRQFILPYDDPFWETHWPPFHFNCRSTVRAIYDEAELPDDWSNVSDLGESPAKGFGEYPVTSDSWWKELDSQVRQAKTFGLQPEIEAAKEILINGVQNTNNAPIQKETAQYIEKMKDMPFFAEDIKPEDRKLVFDDLNRIQPKHAKLLEKYLGKMRGDFYSDKITHYDPKSNKIIMNIKAKDIRSSARNFVTDLKSFLHESGHWLDENALGNGKTIRSQLPELRNLLKKDFINYCNRILPSDNQIKTIDDLFDIVNIDNRTKLLDDLTKDSALKCGVQDIVSGLTGDGLELKYFHPYRYWKKIGIESETVAHFFESNGSGGLVEQYMKETFPSAYEYFNSFIRGL